MPFYKWVIETGQCSRQKEFELNQDAFDVNAIANRRMAQTIQHLSQLARIAHEVFGAIDDECMSILKRTGRLKEKVQKCQSVVDNLNAKTVPVPVSTLVRHQHHPVYKSRHVDESSPIFSTFPRPPEVALLRQLANGPSPPAIIPSTMLADGEQATHIYCQPLDQSLSSKSIMTSTNNVTSSIVPIDVSGQPFSRMSSFRRSLIHVDFFIRRKKKHDKRRNTVTEGDTKEFKDVLHNFINEKSQCPVESKNENKNSNYEQTCDIKQIESNTMNKILNEEKNNNTSEKNTCSIQKFRNGFKLDPKSEEKNKMNTAKNENVTLDLKTPSNSENKRTALFMKRKTKGHIPISTVSAAMSVAVEMRQLNGKIQSEDHSSSGNWSYSSEPNSSDSENRRNSTENRESMILEIEKENSILSKENNKNRLREGSTSVLIPSTKGAGNNKAEISSCASSESNGIIGDETSNATSTESEVFFISSDESDEEISDIVCEPKYGSSISLTTASNGSLNSLLSQTGTEMASSTGTLTSVGLDRLSPPTVSSGIEIERLPTPPPPPPTIIKATVSNLIILDKDIKDRNIQNKKLSHVKLKTSNKQIKSLPKSSKTVKTDELKNSTESSKNIFTSLVGMKTRSKSQNKLKSSEKSAKMVNKPLFNMYGSDSPTNLKQSSFIRENIDPVIKNEPKNSMQSFSTGSIQHKSKNQPENKLNFEKNEHKVEAHMNLQCDNAIPVGASNTEVPSKYIHKVTVTPIQRQTSTEQSDSLLACRKTLFKEPEEQRVKDIYDSKHVNNLNTFHVSDYNREQFNCQKPKPQRPVTLQPQQPKVAARVLLDPEGRIVHCTNSLDRKIHYGYPSERYNCTRDVAIQNGQMKKHGDEISKQIKFYNPNCNQGNSCKTPLTINQFNNSTGTKRYSALASINRMGYRPDTFEPIERYSNNSSFLQHNQQEILNPHKDINNYYYRTDHGVSTQKNYGAQSLPRQRSQLLRNPIVITPDPNISGLPSNDTLLTQYNVNLHSKQMGTFKMLELNNTSNSLEHSYSSINKQLESPVPTEVNKSPSAMSTEDLFAVIHSCKKKMNIKTDSDISLASSSRSNSPSYLRPVTSKGALAETGFLSPRNSSSLDSRDRRSWADFRPSKEIYGERKSLASDRLGPTKPTSMHDFKMLLLQTRSNSQVSGPRKSAVEMLKVPGTYERDTRIDPLTLILPSQNSSYSVPNSPSSDFHLYNGHSTVPFKRNNRTRSTLQPRYTMYPPIFEDCSEDSENNRETLQSADKNINPHKNPHLQHNESTQCENTPQNVRHWV